TARISDHAKRRLAAKLGGPFFPTETIKPKCYSGRQLPKDRSILFFLFWTPAAAETNSRRQSAAVSFGEYVRRANKMRCFLSECFLSEADIFGPKRIIRAFSFPFEDPSPP